MIIKSAEYKTSVVEKSKIIRDDVPEFAFVGRSNVGKSSLINFLVGKKGLAKTSATPGKTKMINYFDINDQFRLVDLPGYGFAKVGKSNLDVWSSLMSDYLTSAENLLVVFVLLDIRHLPTVQDRQMIEFLIYNHIPFCVVATKADKIAKGKYKQSVVAMAKALGVREEVFIVTSSDANIGKDKVLDYMENKLSVYGQ